MGRTLSTAKAAPPPMPSLTIDEAARELGISRSTLKRWIAEGAPVAHTGRRGRGLCTLVDPTVLTAWDESRQPASSQADVVLIAAAIPAIAADVADEVFRHSKCRDKEGLAEALDATWYGITIAVLDGVARCRTKCLS